MTPKTIAAGVLVAVLLLVGSCTFMVVTTTVTAVAPLAAAIKPLCKVPGFPFVASALPGLSRADIDRACDELEGVDPAVMDCILPVGTVVPAPDRSTTVPSTTPSRTRTGTGDDEDPDDEEHTTDDDGLVDGVLVPGTVLVDQDGSVTDAAAEVAEQIPEGTPYAQAEKFLLSAYTGGPALWDDRHTTSTRSRRTQATDLPEPTLGVERLVSLILFTMQESDRVDGGPTTFEDVVSGC